MLKDAMGATWQVPVMTWPHVREINRTLKAGADDLQLPKGPEGVLTDMHHPEVQKWFLAWPGAPIVVAAVLLSDQVGQLKLDEQAFAGRWSGDSIESLRRAIWEAWETYLPPDARSLAEQLARTSREMRAAAAAHLLETFDLLIQGGRLQMTASLAKCRAELVKLQQKKATTPAGRGRKKTCSATPAESESTPNDSV